MIRILQTPKLSDPSTISTQSFFAGGRVFERNTDLFVYCNLSISCLHRKPFQLWTGSQEITIDIGVVYKDLGTRMDVANPHAGANNDGLHKRASFTGVSRTVDMIGRIHSDIFFTRQIHV
jgi:hypothetical protein